MQRWTRRSWLKVVVGTGLLTAGYIRVAEAQTRNTEAGMERADYTDVAETFPVEILRQTFKVRTEAGLGTAFTIEMDERQYIVTAQHLLGSASPETLEIQTSPAVWRRLPVTVISMAGPPVDVAVLATTAVLGSRSSVPVGTGTVGYGQVVRFLGYPLGLEFTHVPDVSQAPLPFIKAGILSALRSVPNEPGLQEFFVDAAGNPGFSGGPLVLPRRSTNKGKSTVWHIAGVVTSGVTHRVPLKDMSGADVGFVDVDAGILRATSIDAVKRMIRANPSGYLLPG